MSRQPSVWQQRSDALRSVSLHAIAQELNEQRLGRRLQEQGPEALLPAHDRANPATMTQVLLAIFRLSGNFSGKRISVDEIAIEMGLASVEQIAAARQNVVRTSSGRLKRKRKKFNKVRRALRDLKDACLVRVDPRDRARRSGGQDANEYSIVWSNIVNLALGQGLQLTLDRVTVGGGRPEEFSGRDQAVSGGAPTHGAPLGGEGAR